MLLVLWAYPYSSSQTKKTFKEEEEAKTYQKNNKFDSFLFLIKQIIRFWQ